MTTQSEHITPIVPASSDIPTVENQNFEETIDHAPAEAPPSQPESLENSEKFEPAIEEKNHYVLRLYGSLINGQKAVVTLTGIQIFFDILVPDKEFIDDFKIKIDVILSSVINTYKIEYIKAFPLRGYHTEKKSYLRIFTLGS